MDPQIDYKYFYENSPDMFLSVEPQTAKIILISTNVQPGSSDEPLGGANYRQDHEQEDDHGDESDSVSAGHEPDWIV